MSNPSPFPILRLARDAAIYSTPNISELTPVNSRDIVHAANLQRNCSSTCTAAISAQAAPTSPLYRNCSSYKMIDFTGTPAPYGVWSTSRSCAGATLHRHELWYFQRASVSIKMRKRWEVGPHTGLQVETQISPNSLWGLRIRHLIRTSSSH